MTEDALLNTPTTALVRLGAATATAMAINANMIAYSTIVTPFVFLFFRIVFSTCSTVFRTIWFLGSRSHAQLLVCPSLFFGGLGLTCSIQFTATIVRTSTTRDAMMSMVGKQQVRCRLQVVGFSRSYSLAIRNFPVANRNFSRRREYAWRTTNLLLLEQFSPSFHLAISRILHLDPIRRRLLRGAIEQFFRLGTIPPKKVAGCAILHRFRNETGGILESCLTFRWPVRWRFCSGNNLWTMKSMAT